MTLISTFTSNCFLENNGGGKRERKNRGGREKGGGGENDNESSINFKTNNVCLNIFKTYNF